MSDMPLITVIIPVYNVELYVDECINSVLNQSYKNLEIIVINDGSTDNSLRKCNTYLADKRVHIYTQNNLGVSTARNKGIEISKGEYILFVDSDDILHKDMIMLLYKQIVKYKCGIACCDFTVFDKKISENEIKRTAAKVNLLTNEDAIVRLVADKGFKGYIWNKLFKSDYIKKIKFKNEECEDLVFNAKAFINSNKIVYMQVPLYFYRNREDAITKSEFCSKHYDIVKSLNQYAEIVMRSFPQCYKKIAAGYVSIYLHFVGKALKGNVDISQDINELKTYIKKNFKSIIKADNMYNFKKGQILLFLIFPIGFYKRLYLYCKK